MGAQGDIVKSLNNAVSVLDIIMNNKKPMSLKEICAVTKQPKSTVHGYLNTLRSRGIVGQDDKGNYLLGNHLFELGMSVYNSWDFVQLTNPVLGKLTRKTGKSSILATLNNDYLMNVNFYPSPNSKIQITPCIGTRIPFHATAQGKVILSGMNDKKIHKILEKHGLTRYTENTIVDENILLEQIYRIRSTGVAAITGEYRPGNHVISVPVKNQDGKIIFALAVMEKAEEANPEIEEFLVTALKTYAEMIPKLGKVVFDNRL